MQNDYMSDKERMFDHYIEESIKSIDRLDLPTSKKNSLWNRIISEIKIYEKKQTRKYRLKHKRMDDSFDIPEQEEKFVKRSEMYYIGELAKIVRKIGLNLN